MRQRLVCSRCEKIIDRTISKQPVNMRESAEELVLANVVHTSSLASSISDRGFVGQMKFSE